MLQKSVQELIDEQVCSDRETGVQVAVYRDGVLVVDAVAGVADPETGRPVTSDTVFYTWSMGKAMTSTLVHRLVSRGLFDYDTPIAAIWPEFGANGKETATVRHGLQHTAGVPGIGPSTTISDICDWNLICARIASFTPWWEPGTRTGYHAYTFGFIMGELIRRATGKPLASVLRDEIGTPLGVASSLHFGMPATEHGRLAKLVDPPSSPDAAGFSLPPDSPMLRSSAPSLWPSAALGNRPDLLSADIPAGGKMTAQAIARMYASLIGPVDGVRLLSPATVAAITTDTFTGEDQVFGMPATWGLGFSVGRLGSDTDNTAFGMGGAGGTYGYADPATGLAVAYCKNRQTADFTSAQQVVDLVAEHA